MDMSELNIIWRKYNLKDNPYFIKPLQIGNENTSISLLFIGREQETNKLINLISSGNERIMIVGDAGVGKTSFVNYVRSKAIEGLFFSPSTEIEINYAMSCQEFLVATLNSIYREIQSKNIILSEKTMQDLESIYNLAKITTNDSIERLSFERLSELFKRTIKEVVYPRFKGIILHYDNLDNIENVEEIASLFGEIRDILLTDKVTSIFVGNKFLPDYIGYKQRVRQIFYFPPIEIKELTYDDIKKIIDERIKYLILKENTTVEAPHTEEALKILFQLYSGNLRNILKSLSACVIEFGKSNNPIIINEAVLRKTLVEKVKRDFLTDLTQVEKEILFKMLDYDKQITPTEVAKLTKKTVQNISSKYLLKLRQKTAVEIIGKEGRNVYYQVRPEIRWIKLQKEENSNKNKEVEEFINQKLTNYI